MRRIRKWLALAAALLLVVGGALAYLAANLNHYLRANRDWLAAQAEAALGRRVAFDSIAASVLGGVAVEIGDLRVADDPAFSDGDFLRARSVTVHVRVLPALLGRYAVRRVSVEQPELSVVRGKGGFNFETLGRPAAKGEGRTRPDAPGVPARVPEFLVALLDVRDGELRIVDQTVTPPAEMVVRGLDVEASDLSLTSPLRIDARAAILGGTERNLTIEGTVGPVGNPPAPLATPLDLELRAGPLDLAALRAVPLVASQLPAGVTLDGSVTLEGHARGTAQTLALDGALALSKVSARQKGAPYEIDGLTGTMTFRGDSAELPPTSFTLGGAPVEVAARIESLSRSAGHVQVKAAALPAAALGLAGAGVRSPEVLRGLDLRLDLRLAGAAPVSTGSVSSAGGSLRDLTYDALRATLAYQDGIATVDDIDVRAYGGSYGGRVRLDTRDPGAPRFESRSVVRGMLVEQLAATHLPTLARELSGRLDADMTLAGSGTEWGALKRTLRGNGRMEVKDGVLKDVNVAASVLDGLGGIGTLTTLVPEGVRRKYPGVFGVGDTRFERLAGSATIADGRARTDDLVVVARDYTMRGAGTVTLDGDVDLAMTLVTSEALTRDITGAVKEARYLADGAGRVSLPFRVTGVAPNLRPQPDATAVARALQRGLVDKGVEALLGGAKGKGGRGGQPQDLLPKGLEGLLGPGGGRR